MTSQNPQESNLWAEITDTEAAQVVGGYTAEPAFVAVPSQKPDGVIPSGKVLGFNEFIPGIFGGEQKGKSGTTLYYPLNEDGPVFELPL
ncbi:hypothetical protein H6G06_20685 [Anabaena sphaerica FACHB-251]|uniref:Uncharacterized protein n=1 Tax=Anabaena sphaerica FACHB-251 TaxID=2692883 RepID=A0A927A2X9_9NOST|nr:hypothetical protein [Anabaena sphaerica]MBD2295823.1 hypothetical protein [Anabaena sphaerica FACHB-251]